MTENFTAGDPRTAGDYEIGYKRPPQYSRWRPGESGNRAGRSKGLPDSKEMLLRILNKKLMGMEDGKRRRISKFELGLTNLVNKAATGDRLAWRELRSTMQYFGLKLGTSDGGLVFIIEE
jgi:hypothetical protein